MTVTVCGCSVLCCRAAVAGWAGPRLASSNARGSITCRFSVSALRVPVFPVLFPVAGGALGAYGWYVRGGPLRDGARGAGIVLWPDALGRMAGI